ncbi:MAG TPA: hypothetical protein VMF64_05510 [Steroidobacteraceae bacterium]|nr:hypothetical protein [Steroidobacteraceae bacterium]
MDQEFWARRSILTLIGGGLAAAVSACGGDDASTSSTSSSSSSTSSTTTGACSTTPEGEIGPYFADDSATGFQRSDITDNVDGTEVQSGVALTFTVTVIDTENECSPMEGVQVDIWHCNASGIYSDIASENTSSQNWLRGYQITDTNGVVTFTTIIPGWYSGRTTHIHLRLRSKYGEASSTTDGTNTTQVFFPQDLIDTLSTSVVPYSAEGSNPTTNATDRVYSQQVDGETLLTLSGSTAGGYSANITVGLPITALSS